MKKRKIYTILTTSLFFATLSAKVCYADNPIVQTMYTTDPAPMVHGDTCYVYTGHDEDGAKYYDMRDWRCYSTDDMVNWGNSYFFYHNGALPGGSGFARSVCVEQFNYNADGSIPTIKMSTNGPKAISNLNPYKQTEAETICNESGIKTEICSEGGMDVGFIDNGEWIKVKGVNFASGARSFEARVSVAYVGGNI